MQRLMLTTAVSTFLPIAAGQDVAFTGLGDLQGGNVSSVATAVSAGGNVVTGYSQTDVGTEAFVWNPTDGLTPLGFLPGGGAVSNPLSQGIALSADGSSVVGTSTLEGGGLAAFRWSQGTGFLNIGDLPGSGTIGVALGVSADGGVVVGSGLGQAGLRPFRWDEEGGMTELATLRDGSGDAFAITPDGNRIVGVSSFEATVWDSDGVPVGLGDLPRGDFSSEARAVSADGSTIVGFGTSRRGPTAFYWTEASGMVGLGDLAGGAHDSVATAVSADGSVIAGRAYDSSGDVAFVWNESSGMRSLKDMLIDDFGLADQLSGWQLTAVRGVTPDGLTFVGEGTGPDGNDQGWIVTIPEPASLCLAVLGASCVIRRPG